jgi:nucleoside triphosphate diphosphatase
MADLGKLVALVARLRAPGGCPWDREQGLADLRAYLLEESHEAAAALDRVVAAERGAGGGDGGGGGEAAGRAWDELAGELGDLLFQAAFVLRLGEEAGRLDAAAVVERVHAKMIERHPHVFPPADGDREELADAAAVARAWERRKLARGGGGSLLAGVPASLPALLGAYRLTQKAAGVGFDWPDAGAVLAKVDEEVAELRAEIAAGDRAAAAEEVGDLLFTVANLGRKLGIDPEAALAATNAKFRRRFAAVEAGLEARGRRLGEAGLDEMDALWEAAKRDG